MRTAPRVTDGKPQDLPSGRRFDRRSLIALIAAIAVASTAATYLYLSRGPRELTVDRAVEAFREAERGATEPKADGADTAAPANGAEKTKEQQAAPVTAPAAAKDSSTSTKAKEPFPAPRYGVYSYDTKGYQSTDALSGQRHDYPAETTITLRKGDKGWLSRWQPLEERWEETLIAEDTTGARMLRYTMYHEFFQRGVTEVFECDGYVEKIGAKVGDSWPVRCTSEQSKVDIKVTFASIDAVKVGDDTVKAKRIVYDATVSGTNKGKMLQQRWLTEDPRGMVRMSQKADLDVDSPFGAVGYKEDFEINLQSFEPQT
jgi:hypothetical protein